MWGFLGRLISTLYSGWRDYVDVPSITIDFDSVHDVQGQCSTVNPDHLGYSMWVRFRVTNCHRRRAIKECRAFLTSLERIGGDGKRFVPINDQRELIWNGQRETLPAAQTILPRQTNRVDVAATFNDSEMISFRCYPKADCVPGLYIARIQVSADGIEPKEIQLQIKWDGKLFDSLVALRENI